MSAFGILGSGILLMAVAAGSSPGGSIRSDARAHPTQRGRAHPGEDPSRVSGPDASGHAMPRAAAENLADPHPGPGPSSVNKVSSNGPATGLINGLSLGMSGGTAAAGLPSTAPLGIVLPPAPLPAPAPIVVMAQTVAVPPTADALINFGAGPYSEAASLTGGTPQAFFNSPAFGHFFGPGGPTSADVTTFEQEVLAQIRSTYNNAGLPIRLTTDPGSPAAHTISVVSGTSYSGNSGAIGITDVGHDGFSFLDKLAGTQTVDQLATAVGNNISHELMHAFGIADHPEQVGPYVDAAASTLQALADPSTGFSPAAASLLSTLNFQAVGRSVTAAGAQLRVDGDQVLLGPSAVPEPSTVALWVAVGGLVVARRRRRAAWTEAWPGAGGPRPCVLPADAVNSLRDLATATRHAPGLLDR